MMTDVTFERTSPNRRMVCFMKYLPGEMRACFSDAQQSPEFTHLAPTVRCISASRFLYYPTGIL